MIYVHVPFCRSFCTYCGFYSEVAPRCRKSDDTLRQEREFEDYLTALDAEIRVRQNEIQRMSASEGADTLYIGGGTPSVLSLHMLERLLASLGRQGFREFTLEVNPEDIVEKGAEYVAGLLSLGVNRISMGVQSFDDGILRWMNRRHSASQAVEAYRILEDAGVGNISIDLIFGLPQMTGRLWEETVRKAMEISPSGVPPKHISAYQLSVEEDSMLEKMIAEGKCFQASEEACESQYSVLCKILGEAGYNHYEISNFAVPGYEAVHNSAYWRDVPYVGLGPGAHSYMGGMRQWNEADLRKYIAAGQKGDFSSVRGGEVLDSGQKALERIMLGLRTSAGVSLDYLRGCCRETSLEEALHRGNLIVREDGSVRIPEDRFFISDNIISSLV